MASWTRGAEPALDPVYPAIFLDALWLKFRDAVYVALAFIIFAKGGAALHGPRRAPRLPWTKVSSVNRGASTGTAQCLRLAWRCFLSRYICAGV
jgi:hypothetical protein